MKFAPNPWFIPFRDMVAPAKWVSKTARYIFESARKGDDARHAVTGNIRVAYQPAAPEDSEYGTPPEIAAKRALAHATTLERRAREIRATVQAYGGSAFVASRQPIPNRVFDFADPEGSIRRILNDPRAPTHIFANGSEFALDPLTRAWKMVSCETPREAPTFDDDIPEPAFDILSEYEPGFFVVIYRTDSGDLDWSVASDFVGAIDLCKGIETIPRATFWRDPEGRWSTLKGWKFAKLGNPFTDS